MLAYQSNILKKNNPSVALNRTVGKTNPNKRGCCQTKRRNYNLLATSNGISAPSNKSCCSKSGDSEGSSCSSCSSKSKNNKSSVSKNSEILKDSKYSLDEINAAQVEFKRLESLALINKNEFLEIFDSNSNRQVTPYSNEQVKAKLENPELQLDVVSKIDSTKNSINISIIDVNKRRKYLDQTFEFKANESNIEKYENSVVIHTFARWIALQVVYKKQSSKKLNETQDHNPKKIDKQTCQQDYGIDSECMCINHDMGCTSEPLITRGGKFKFWFMCAGSFETDVFECCYNHDIALWCTSGYDTAIELAVVLIACMEGKIIDKYLEKSSEICAFFGLPLLMVTLLSLPLILSPLIGVIMEIATRAEFRNSNGDHDDSCLCGGDLPTVCCSGYDGVCRDECCNKIDLCSHKLDKTRGNWCKQKPKCGKKCTFFVYPNSYNPTLERLSSYTIFKEKEEYYLATDPSKKLKKSDCCTVSLPNDCTDECFNCYYACKLNPNGRGMSWKNGKVLIDSSYLGAGMRGVPCCEGTPNEDLNSKSNYCQKDYGKGGGGIPDCGSPRHKRLGGPCNEVNRNNERNNNLTQPQFS